MQAAIETKAGEPWYADALEAVEAELAGDFADGAELGELARRMMPFYYARYGERERAHVESMAGEELCADATRLWEKEIFEHYDLRPQLAGLTIPTLVIAGEEDFIAGPACAAELTEGIPEPETVLLPGIGHMIFVEAPEEFRRAILSFLGDGAARA